VFPQLTVPPPHWQTPFTHDEVASQTFPHEPQLLSSVLVSTQAPLHT
jgi:hypothetical protein